MLKINQEKFKLYQQLLCEKKCCVNAFCFAKLWIHFMEENRDHCGILTKKIVDNAATKACQILEPSEEGLILARGIIYNCWHYDEEFKSHIDPELLNDSLIKLRLLERDTG